MERMQRPGSSSKAKPSKTPRRATTKSPLDDPEPETVITHGQNRYHLGQEIGRGGYAVVFQAFNAHTGQTVAVKRFPLSAIAGKDSQISVELAEIELMHELDHPNIVKYYDTVKTKNFLYIVLEYMENGSLVNLIKKFGCFSEALTAIYITQVLKGLKYLHDQGVLHRDIKGANILTSKDGMVKLADFGVAMKMNDTGTSNAVAGSEEGPDWAGSPYWMAPEIIEMSTPTPACDIWSVGCVVVELLTSKAPYFDLGPVSALFRIVSDDYPPFPEGISQALKDFLLQCFHKEPTMRSSAEKLLAHPWLSNSSSRQSLVQTSEMLRSRSIDAGDSSIGQSTEVIQSALRMYERNLHTIPESEHELDSDRSRSGRRPDPPSAVPPGATSTAAQDSVRLGAGADTDGRNTTESVSDDPAMVMTTDDSMWRSVPLTGSTSLPGSAGSAGSVSRSRSHSGDVLHSITQSTYDASLAISAESARSSQNSAESSAKHSTTPPVGKSNTANPATSEQDSAAGQSDGSPSTAKAVNAGLRRAAKLELQCGSEDLSSEDANPKSARIVAASGSGSFLQGMKLVSEDSFDETNWDIDMSVSRDSTEEASAPQRPSLLRNALGVARISPARHLNLKAGQPLPKAPYLINLNSQSLSFSSSQFASTPLTGASSETGAAFPFTSPNDGGAAPATGKASPSYMDGFDDDSDPEPASQPVAEQQQQQQKQQESTPEAAAAATPVPASTATAPWKANIPMIKIPVLALPQPSGSILSATAAAHAKTPSVHSGSGRHSAVHSSHSAVDLGKYQEDDEDDDFGDLEASDCGPASPRSTPRSPRRRRSSTKLGVQPQFSPSSSSGKSGFAAGASAQNSQQTSPVVRRPSQPPQYLAAAIEDADLDGDFEGEGFADKIHAYKTGARQGQATREPDSLSSARATTDDSGALQSPHSGGVLASKLRRRIQQVTTKEAHDEDLDAFLNYQYDEKDFKQNEAKDLHFRRSREIVEIMNRIRQEIKVKEIIDLCNQLMAIFSEVPEQRDHLITHHGVMPIVDMFDARLSTSTFRTSSQSSKSVKALYVLKVVNKIIDGNVKAKEQLSLVGIIPTVMNLFESSFKQSIYHQHTPAPTYTVPFLTQNYSSSTSTDSIGDNSLQQPGITLTTTPEPRPPLAPTFVMREDIDPVTLEAARFIHQICCTSSLTLQMLIGAGGLSVLTGMVSLGATLSPSLLGQNAMNNAAATASASASQSTGTPGHTNPNGQATTPPHAGQRSMSGSASPSAAASAEAARSNAHGIATIATFSTDFADVIAPVTDQQLADDSFFNPGARPYGVPTAAETEDLMTRMQIFQMGVDCVCEVFSMKSSRSRDFCRLFVKLGLLHPLSLSFHNVMAMYKARQVNLTTTATTSLPTLYAAGTVGETASSSSTGATPRESGKGSALVASQAQQHRRDSSGTSSAPSPRHRRESSGGSSGAGSFYLHAHHQEAEESAECKYSLRMATLFVTFSRSDAIVAETMVKAEHGVLHTLLGVLQAPELRAASGGRMTPSAAQLSKPDVPLSSASLSAHNASHSGSSPNLFKRVHSQHLLPTYVEIVDLLLKCLKNLSMEPSALADLEAAGTLETLIPLLSGPISDRCRNHILPCIFNMCRINKRRQERVAVLGIVPHLKKVILDSSPLRQFALPILFDLAHTSAATRAELGRWNCQPFFLDLLKENYWQAFALNSLAVWLTSEPSSVVGMLIEPAHLSKLIDFFKAAQSQTIQTLHRPLLDMMLKSPELCQALGQAPLFTHNLVKRLRGTDEAIVLRSLLKMLQLMHEAHQTPQEWVETNHLVSVVEEFAKSERKVLVRQLAKKLLLDFTGAGWSEKSEA